MSDRIAVLRGGDVQQVAEPEVLYEEPERSFVARFIGENNRLHGRVWSVDGDICEVETGGQTICALRVAACGPGDATTLSIRPERVAISPDPGLYTNELDARIEDITFLGDHLRVRVNVCGRSDFIAKIPNIVGHGAMLVGDEVRIGWTPTDCRVLDPDDEAETT